MKQKLVDEGWNEDKTLSLTIEERYRKGTLSYTWLWGQHHLCEYNQYREFSAENVLVKVVGWGLPSDRGVGDDDV